MAGVKTKGPGYRRDALWRVTGKFSPKSHRYVQWTFISLLGFKMMGTKTVVVVVHLLYHVWLFATPWTAACQASLSFTVSWSLLRFMSIELVMISNHLIIYCPLLLLPLVFPRVRERSSSSFPVSWLFASGCQNIGASALASVLTMNIQGWFPGLISLQSKGLSSLL